MINNNKNVPTMPMMLVAMGSSINHIRNDQYNKEDLIANEGEVVKINLEVPQIDLVVVVQINNGEVIQINNDEVNQDSLNNNNNSSVDVVQDNYV
jgi:hypothetical protein